MRAVGPVSPVVRLGVGLILLLAGLGAPGRADAALSFGPLQDVTSSPGNSGNPHFVFDYGGTLHLVWAEDLHIQYARSSDRGQTFTPPIQVAAAGDKPRVAIHGAAVYVVWHEDTGITSFEKEIKFSRSLDGGQTFSAPINLSNTAGLQSQRPRMAVGPSGTIFVVWDEASPSLHVALARSVDGGATFEAPRSIAPVSLTPTCAPGVAEGFCTSYPAVAVDQTNGNVYVTWHDIAPSALQVLFMRSVDGGQTFSAPRNISQATFQAHCASMTVGPSGRILIAFEDGKSSGVLSTNDAVFVQSTDGGLNFSAPINLSNSPSFALSDYPWAAEGPDGTIAVGWEDNSSAPELEAVVAVSTDGGVTFGPPLNLSSTTNGTSTEVVTLFGPDGSLYVVWEDHLTGDSSVPADILLRRALAPLPAAPLVSLVVKRGIDGPAAIAFHPGDVLDVDAVVSNPGAGRSVDAFFGFLLPSALGPSLGCPAGDAVAFLTNNFTGVVISCASSPPQTFAPLVRNVSLSGAMAPLLLKHLVTFSSPADVVTGPYTMFLLFTSVNAFQNGRIDPGDVVTLKTADLTFGP